MLVVLVFPIMVSCSKDSDNDDGGGSSLPVTKENLIGGWVNEHKDIKSVFVFKSDDKGDFTYFVGSTPYGRLSYTFTYKIIGDKLIISDLVNYEKEKIKGESEYTVTLYQNKLLLKGEFGTDTYTRDNFWQ